MPTARAVRASLIDALRLDLIGPDTAHCTDDVRYADERLPIAPSRWYLTGFLVPNAAPESQRFDETSVDELELAGDADVEGDDDVETDKTAAKKDFFR